MEVKFLREKRENEKTLMKFCLLTSELECTCVDGYELSDDGSFCQDINECEAYGSEDEDSDESQQYSFCSHTCANTIGEENE